MTAMKDDMYGTEVTVLGTRLLLWSANRVDNLVGPPGMVMVINWVWTDLDYLITHLLPPAPAPPVLKPKTPISIPEDRLGRHEDPFMFSSTQRTTSITFSFSVFHTKRRKIVYLLSDLW